MKWIPWWSKCSDKGPVSLWSLKTEVMSALVGCILFQKCKRWNNLSLRFDKMWQLFPLWVKLRSHTVKGSKWKRSEVWVQQGMLSNSVVSNSLWLNGLYPSKLPCPWNFLGKNTGVGCYSRGSFRPRGSSRPRDCTRVSCGSCVERRILYQWGMSRREG